MPSKILFSQKQIALMTLVAAFFIALLTSVLVANIIHGDTTTANHNSTVKNPSHNKLIVHISSGTDEPHSIMMGLNKALKARQEGIEVFVYADVKATEVMMQQTDISFADFP